MSPFVVKTLAWEWETLFHVSGLLRLRRFKVTSLSSQETTHNLQVTVCMYHAPSLFLKQCSCIAEKAKPRGWREKRQEWVRFAGELTLQELSVWVWSWVPGSFSNPASDIYLVAIYFHIHEHSWKRNSHHLIQVNALIAQARNYACLFTLFFPSALSNPHQSYTPYYTAGAKGMEYVLCIIPSNSTKNPYSEGKSLVPER